MADRDDSPGGSFETFDPRGDAVAVRRTVLFVCRHGAAKSVLAAADCRRVVAERGLDMEAVAAGLDPDPQVAHILLIPLCQQD